MILSKCYTPDLWLRAWPQDSCLKAYLTLPWLSRFLQPKQNFLNHLIIVLRSNVPSLFIQQMFLVGSTQLYPSLNSWSISFQIKLHSTFICVAFKSHMEWSNVYVSTPTTVILPSTAWITSITFYMYHKQVCIKILQNFWLS